MLPQVLSGEHDARVEADKADKALFELAQEKMDALPNGSEEKKWIADTVYFLKNKEQLKPWQEIMARAFLMHLVNIPLVVHCKSCVDRTNVVNAMVTAMKQWLRSGQEIPEIEGRAAIFEMVNRSITAASGEIVYPFKELFAFNMHKGLKISELARGHKGYRYHRGFQQHPVLVDLLPARYLRKNPAPGFFKRWVVPIAAAILPPLVLQVLATVGLAIKGAGLKKIGKVWQPQKYLWKKSKILTVVQSILFLLPLQFILWGAAIVTSLIRTPLSPKKIGESLLMPAKFIWNAGQLYPEKSLDEGHELVGPREFLEA